VHVRWRRSGFTYYVHYEDLEHVGAEAEDEGGTTQRLRMLSGTPDLGVFPVLPPSRRGSGNDDDDDLYFDGGDDDHDDDDDDGLLARRMRRHYHSRAALREAQQAEDRSRAERAALAAAQREAEGLFESTSQWGST
jgi:hypothetical protein